uniref:Uncharacterized protein n=1 Tax=Chenopodium quinoa TaxID=63459 RepID=A0A803NBH0_CHEQI
MENSSKEIVAVNNSVLEEMEAGKGNQSTDSALEKNDKIDKQFEEDAVEWDVGEEEDELMAKKLSEIEVTELTTSTDIDEGKVAENVELNAVEDMIDKGDDNRANMMKGLGSAYAMNAFKRIVITEHPQLSFLSETRLKSFEMGRVKAKLGFENVFAMNLEENKVKTGALLEKLAGMDDAPWVCGGDFNLMLMACEKQGGSVFNVAEPEILRQAASVCNFEDLGYVGYDFTLNNNRGGEANLQERLTASNLQL